MVSKQNYRTSEFGREPWKSPSPTSLLEDRFGKAGCLVIYTQKEDLPEPSLLQIKQFQLSQLLLVWKMPQPINHFSDSSLGSLKYVHVTLVLGIPDLDAALQTCLAIVTLKSLPNL